MANKWVATVEKVPTISTTASRLLSILEKEETSETIRPIVDLPEDFESLSRWSGKFERSMAMSFLKSRGVTMDDVVKWQIGYSARGEYSRHIIFPSFDISGDCNFFVGRTYFNNKKKYNTPKVQTDIVFNELFVDWSKDVVLVEGVFDAIKSDGIPLLGSTLKRHSKLFREIVRRQDRVYIALDADAENKAQTLIADLLEYDVEVMKIDTTQIEDIGAISKHEFQMLKKAARPMNTTSLLKLKLEKIL